MHRKQAKVALLEPFAPAKVSVTDKTTASVKIYPTPVALVAVNMAQASVSVKHVCSTSAEEIFVLAGTDGVFIDKFGEYIRVLPNG